jgi:hypothetical protein
LPVVYRRRPIAVRSKNACTLAVAGESIDLATAGEGVAFGGSGLVCELTPEN